MQSLSLGICRGQTLPVNTQSNLTFDPSVAALVTLTLTNFMKARKTHLGNEVP